jgi:O-antigen ligase
MGNNYSTQFTLIFIVYCTSLSAVSRMLSVLEIMDVFLVTVIFIVFTILMSQSEHLMNALSVTMTAFSGLLRFTPLGMHPNLAGMVYGGASVALIYAALSEDAITKKILFVAAGLTSVSFIVASSARSSLLALFVICIVTAYQYVKYINNKRLSYSLVALLTLSGTLIISFDIIFNYFSTILEFNSNTRGIDSGGTGRTELWSMGINVLSNDWTRLFFGYGLRTSEANVIGFSLENSYLTLLFEVGIINTCAFLIIVIVAIVLMLRKSKDHDERGIGPYFSVAMLIFFLLIQSFFNRYLLSIGNFYSAFFLLLLFSCFQKENYNLYYVRNPSKRPI